MTAPLAAGDGGGGGGGRASSPSVAKGKAKIDAEAAAEAWTCGICLARSREAIRGELDCCAHNFCFVCIMAWARVESRCPFCKARFRTIRRPPVPGRFPAERVVAVPERNQVFLGEGNGSSTVADPYANTICTLCNCCQHDELLILCDLCDSAAHTYCVGLGTVVPEGDWFCEDCAASKEAHSRCQVDDEGLCGQGEFQISIDVPAAKAIASLSACAIVNEDNATGSGNRTHVQRRRISMDDLDPSIYDIVGDDYTTNAGTIRLRGNSQNSQSQGASSAGSQCPNSTRVRDNGLASYHALIRMEVERTRALRNSRNRDKRIKELRESWASLRDGSLGFRTHIPSRRTQGGIQTIPAVTEHKHFAVPTVVCSRNGASGSSGNKLSSASLFEEPPSSLGHGYKTPQKDTRDARKAWKMLQMAKSTCEKKVSNKPSSLSCSPPFSMGNRSTSHSPIDTILGLKNQKINKVDQKNSADSGHGTKMESASTTENSGQLRSLPESSRLAVHERIISFQDRINEESLNGEVAASNNHHHDGQTSEPFCGTDRSERVKSDTLHPVNFSLSSGQSTVTSSLQLGLNDAANQCTVMVNLEDSSAICVATTDEIHSSATVQVRKNSGSDHHERKRKHSSEKHHDQTSKRSRSSCKIAKTEISSLAIRELKLLKIDKTYGSDTFKEVARTATHTVLAACGFEHSPSRSLAISRPACEHSSEVKLVKSSVTTNSCAECLRDFVKEAIGLALSCRQMDKTAATS